MIGWKDLVEVVSRSMRLAEGKRSTLVARIQAMQKPPYDFPASQHVGRGTKASYSADQLVQLLYVLEFLDVGVPPGQAISFVREQWPMLQRTTGRAMLKPYRSYPDADFLTVRLNALNGLRDNPRFVPSPQEEADPEWPWLTQEGLVDLTQTEVTVGVARDPEWFHGVTLIYVGHIGKELMKHVQDTIGSIDELMGAARRWTAS